MGAGNGVHLDALRSKHKLPPRGSDEADEPHPPRAKARHLHSPALGVVSAPTAQLPSLLTTLPGSGVLGSQSLPREVPSPHGPGDGR